MSFNLVIGKESVVPEKSHFPAGELMIRLPKAKVDVRGWDGKLPVAIYFNYEGDAEVFELALLVDALRRKYREVELSLVMPYLPYARQDRVCNPGESLSVKVFADFINSLKFDRVYCKDIHSDVGASLINNLVHTEQHTCADKVANLHDKERTVVVSPDAGAMKKCSKFAKHYGFSKLVRADKERDVRTGQITGTKVYSDHIGNDDFLILDDIGDGMGTFIALGNELRKLTNGKIYLYVTHAILSKGVDILYPTFDKVYSANIMLKDWKEKDSHGILVAL